MTSKGHPLGGLLFLIILVISGCAGKGHVYKHNTPAKLIKLCFIGDTGTDGPVQKAVADLLEKEKCHSIHFVGDIVYPNGIETVNDQQFKKKFYDYYYKLTEQDFQPRLYIILGNHDHNGSVAAWEEVSDKYKNIMFPSPWYLVKMNNLCLVHLDTEYYKLFWDILDGHNQKSWLKKIEKEEMKDCSKKIALTHHPYESRGKHHGPSDGILREFLEENIIGKYDYLISGHEHILSDEGVIKGTHLLISGAGGFQGKNEHAGFLVLTWNQDNNEIQHTFKRVLE